MKMNRMEMAAGRRARRGMLLTVGLLLGLAPLLEAQQRGRQRRGPPQDRDRMEQMIRQRFGQMIRERLGLEEEEARRLGETMEGFQEERETLSREEQAVRRRMEALMLEGGEDQEAARALLERMFDLRAREVELFRREQEGLLEVLTPVQVLRFHHLRQELARRIERLRRQGRPGPGGEGLPPFMHPFGDPPPER